MALKTQLKKYRQQFGWTQKQLAEKLHVSDKTISSWENGRTYPDVGMLLALSDVFQISIDQFIRGDDVMVQKIDRDIKMKRVYKIILAFIVFVIAGLSIFFNVYQYKNQWVDRFNPFMTMQTGYATLPTKTKDGHVEKGSPYKDIEVLDDEFGQATRLTFFGGMAPAPDRHYAIVKHKGLYVQRIMFISWSAIPKIYRENMNKTYQYYPKMKDTPVRYNSWKTP
ncbi:MAG: YxeA family protein [Lactobacillus sp.]|jgi:uncharacterized protein (TIGR01655 family)|nr:YxeA family protein [Lactobacillus sp.]